MSALPKQPARESLTIRIRAEDRGLIDEAARISGQTRTDFIIDAARRLAQERLLDRTFFALDDDAYTAFVERLEAPPRSNPGLERLMRGDDPWDDEA